MTRILIRCDASLMMGSGHVMRCRTLARELQRSSAEVSFLCRRQRGDLISLLEHEFEVLSLPEQPLAACDGLEGRDLYAAWLGCSQEQDAAQCLEVLAQAGFKSASWLVADHYGLDARWEELLIAGLTDVGEPTPKLLVIDDLADRSHQADILLDQNFFGEATESRYVGLVTKHCRQLLGPHYALLGPEYAQLHSLVPARTELKRVLVYFGGVDPLNLALLSLETLCDSEFLDLAVDVVVGQQDSNYDSINKLASLRANTNLHRSLPSLAGLITRADLSIGAGGSTTWERACLGLPSLVVALDFNQMPFVQALDQLGYVKSLGNAIDITKQQLHNEVLLRRYDLTKYQFCKDLTDGLGTHALSSIMLSKK